jgi:hypothetical protein
MEPADRDNLTFRTHLDCASMLPISDTHGTLPVEQHLLTKTPFQDASWRDAARASGSTR